MKPEIIRPFLLVEKFDECFRFYRDVMKFKVAWGKEGDSYASFIIGNNMRMALFKRGQMAETVKTTNLPPDSECQDKFALVFEVKRFDEIVGELRKLGANFMTQIIKKPDWGIRTIFLRDPGGNLLQIESEIPKEQWTESLRKEARMYHPDQ
jgi:lactoylglutathione lyase